MLFTTKTWDKFHIKSNLKSKTVDTLPVTRLLQTQLFLASISLAIAVEVNVRNITKNGLDLLWQPGQNGRKRFKILAHSEILMIVGGWYSVGFSLLRCDLVRFVRSYIAIFGAALRTCQFLNWAIPKLVQK